MTWPLPFSTGGPGLAAEFVFWGAAALVVYSYAGYALLVAIAARLFGREPRPAPSQDVLPTITLLIAAHNEEQVIAERLDNALKSDYPRERLRIVVASDGSLDRTTALVRGFADRDVELLDFTVRRGKASVLNDALSRLDTELVALSDANTFYEPEALRRLARWFADPSIGAVCGRLVLTDPATGNNVDSLYWRYETFLKRCENRLNALLGANGAIYAIRRSLYTPIPPETIVDDFVIPLLARIKHGCRVVYDAAAAAHEESPAAVADEFRRRARIGAGGFQSLGPLRSLLHPRWGWLWFAFVSHKLLRWTCPFFLLAMLAANVCLLDQALYRALFVAQLLFYGTSLLAGRVPGAGLPARVLRLSSMFTSINLALLVGFWRWLSGRQRGAWQRTAR